jgi:hypothetical protein
MLLGAFALPASAADVEEGFVSLFNGQDLTGWVKRGGSAEYEVQDGCDHRNLCSRYAGQYVSVYGKEFGNFVLKLQYKFLEPGNSGVQFRSAARPEGDRERVYGYQYEIAVGGGPTGRIYDEGRRGHKFGVIWLDIYTPQDRLEAARPATRGRLERRRNPVRRAVDQDLAERQSGRRYVRQLLHEGLLRPADSFRQGRESRLEEHPRQGSWREQVGAVLRQRR